MGAEGGRAHLPGGGTPAGGAPGAPPGPRRAPRTTCPRSCPRTSSLPRLVGGGGRCYTRQPLPPLLNLPRRFPPSRARARTRGARGRTAGARAVGAAPWARTVGGLAGVVVGGGAEHPARSSGRRRPATACETPGIFFCPRSLPANHGPTYPWPRTRGFGAGRGPGAAGRRPPMLLQGAAAKSPAATGSLSGQMRTEEPPVTDPRTLQPPSG